MFCVSFNFYMCMTCCWFLFVGVRARACVCEVPTCTQAYLLLHRARLHSQSPVCCMRDPSPHNSWLLPCLTKICSETQDTSFLFEIGLPHFPLSSHFTVKSLFSLFPYQLVCTSSNSYRHDKGDPWHKRLKDRYNPI